MRRDFVVAVIVLIVTTLLLPLFCYCIIVTLDVNKKFGQERIRKVFFVCLEEASGETEA